MRGAKEIYEDMYQAQERFENNLIWLEQEYYGRNFTEDNDHNRNV